MTRWPASARALAAVRRGCLTALLLGLLAPAAPTMAAVLTVTTAADDLTPNDGGVSLREAIAAVNAGNNLGDPDITAQAPGVFGVNDTIDFNVGGGGEQGIDVGSSPSASGLPLPAIVKPVTIDGATQGAFAGTPLIALNGSGAGANASGLETSASGLSRKV